jgi:hypothetical protein
VSARLQVGTDALTAMHNRKTLDAFEFSVLLTEDGAGRLELTKA